MVNDLSGIFRSDNMDQDLIRGNDDQHRMDGLKQILLEIPVFTRRVYGAANGRGMI